MHGLRPSPRRASCLGNSAVIGIIESVLPGSSYVASIPLHPITQLLDAAGNGDAAAKGRLLEAIYGELHRLADRQLACEPGGWSLQPTALVHEAYLRLFPGEPVQYPNRRHFFAAAALAMRRIRVDYARRRSAEKRGGADRRRTAVDPGDAESVAPRLPAADDAAELLDLDAALTRLESEHPDLAELVQLRYFGGLSVDEAAEALGVSPRTIDNQWRLARAWLYGALAGQPAPRH